GGGWRAGVGVAVEAGEVRGTDLDAQAVAGLEEVAGGPEVDRVLVREAGLGAGGGAVAVTVAGAQEAVAEVGGVAVGVDVEQLGGEVGVGGVGGGPEVDADGTGNLEVL